MVMKKLIFLFFLIFLTVISVQSQEIDTLVDVGGYNMHFSIIKGQGIPILFDAGAGDDGSVWNNILEPIQKVTGATLITYDRSGFGKSELNPSESEDSNFGIMNGIKELEIGLEKLGYNKDVILVSHSYGGLHNLLYTSRNPNRVKSIIFIDALLNTIKTDKVLDKYFSSPLLEEDYKGNMGMYYLIKNYKETIIFMRTIDYPTSTPIVNLYAERTFVIGSELEEIQRRWNMIHKEFSNSRPNVKPIVAQGSNHYIFKDNPSLTINTIIKAYSETLNEDQQNDILKKALDNAIDLSVEAKKSEMEYLHSESYLNQWGYKLIQDGELEKALEVLKLNTILYPESWNVYDSYGEVLIKLNRKLEAIEMYEKSIELNPENEKGKSIIEKIKQKR